MNVNSIYTINSYTKLDVNKFKSLFYTHYYDGPLAGVGLYDGIKIYYAIDGRLGFRNNSVDKFLLTQITNEQFNIECHFHMFVKSKFYNNSLNKFYEELANYDVDISNVIGFIEW